MNLTGWTTCQSEWACAHPSPPHTSHWTRVHGAVDVHNLFLYPILQIAATSVPVFLYISPAISHVIKNLMFQLFQFTVSVQGPKSAKFLNWEI